MNLPSDVSQNDPAWIREFAQFLNQNNNMDRLKEVKTIFIQTYIDNIHDGMNPQDALHHARSIALCSLII
jgi:hypothetical protein